MFNKYAEERLQITFTYSKRHKALCVANLPIHDKSFWLEYVWFREKMFIMVNKPNVGHDADIVRHVVAS